MTPVQQVFLVVLHALACFLHFAWRWSFEHGGPTPTEALCIGALLLALVVPTDRRAFLALLLAELLDVAVSMPKVPNHWLLTAIFDVFVLAALVARPTDGLRVLRAPAAVAVTILYLWTGIWKLTTEWFDPAVSCGALAWYRLVAQFPFLPHDGMGPALAIHATLVLELVLPLFLLSSRTRGPATLVFVLFHAMLALDVVQDFLNFSSVMWGLLFLLVDEAAIRRLEPLVPAVRLLARGWAVLIVLLLVLAAFPATHPAYTGIRWTAAIATVVPTVAVVYGRLAVPGGPDPRPVAWAWMLPVLVMLNGLSPWLGLKTRNSWQMYSNLRIEHDASNHMVLPRSLDLFGWLGDRVEVLEVSDPELAKEWAASEALTFHTLRTELSRRPEASVRYRRAGEEHVVARVGDDPDLSRPYPFPVRKFVWFRPLGPGEARICQW